MWSLEGRSHWRDESPPVVFAYGKFSQCYIRPILFSLKCNTCICTNFREMFLTHLTVSCQKVRTRTATFFTPLDTTLQFGPAAVTECCQVVASARCGMFGIRMYEPASQYLQAMWK